MTKRGILPRSETDAPPRYHRSGNDSSRYALILLFIQFYSAASEHLEKRAKSLARLGRPTVGRKGATAAIAANSLILLGFPAL